MDAQLPREAEWVNWEIYLTFWFVAVEAGWFVVAISQSGDVYGLMTLVHVSKEDSVLDHGMGNSLLGPVGLECDGCGVEIPDDKVAERDQWEGI